MIANFSSKPLKNPKFIANFPQCPLKFAKFSKISPEFSIFRLFFAGKAALSSKKPRKSSLETAQFLQSRHLQRSEHWIPAWKHSQYFLEHAVFWQLQPLACVKTAKLISFSCKIVLIKPRKTQQITICSITLGLKAMGFLNKVLFITFCRSSRFSSVFAQFSQLQPLHTVLAAKHSQ